MPSLPLLRVGGASRGELPAETLDPVEKELALLIVKQFVVEAIYRFPEDLPQNAVVVHNGLGHRVRSYCPPRALRDVASQPRRHA